MVLVLVFGFSFSHIQSNLILINIYFGRCFLIPHLASIFSFQCLFPTHFQNLSPCLCFNASGGLWALWNASSPVCPVCPHMPPPRLFSPTSLSPTESTLRSAHKCSMCFSTLFDGTVPYKCRILFSQQGVWFVHKYNPSHQHVNGLAQITSFSVNLSTSPIEVHCVYKVHSEVFQF